MWHEKDRQINLSFADATSGHYIADDRYASYLMGQQARSSSSHLHRGSCLCHCRS
uniref:Uncharacterized protein n=1 Tax=Medicago truncatula TaxID=3880 RepID=A2Q252_MEDTR|nr:hypothetical protein MtrDRAFT_AC149208g39v2 [Medicago truncatula]